MVPFIFPNLRKHYFSHMVEETFNINQVVGTAMWLLSHSKIPDPDMQFIRLFHTNGHKWCLYEVHEQYVKKTKFFTPSSIGVRKDPNKLLKFYDDYNHMQTILGLIRFALSNIFFNLFKII